MIEISQENLSAGLAAVIGSAASSSTLPVLHNVLVEGEGGVVTLAATNLAVATTVRIPAVIDDDGFRITVPAKQFSALVGTRPSEKAIRLRFDEEKKEMRISQGRWRAKMKGIDAEEFPLIHRDFSGSAHFTLPLDEWNYYLAMVDFCAHKTDSRPALNGIHLVGDPDEGKTELTATDGFRLGRYTTDIAPSATIDAIIPYDLRGTLSKIKSALGLDEEEEVTCSVSDSQILMKGDGWEILAQLIADNFPDASPILNMPKDVPGFLAEADELMQMVTTAAIVAKEATQTVQIDANEDEGMGVKSFANEYGETGERKGCKMLSPQSPVDPFGVNFQFVKDVLAVHRGGMVRIHNKDKVSPIYIYSDDHPGGQWVIMTMVLGR